MGVEINKYLDGLMYYLCIYCEERDGKMDSYNMYLGRLLQLKLELEDYIDLCVKEIKKINEKRKNDSVN